MDASPINLKTSMNIIKMYYYFFYKIYSLMEYFQSKGAGNKFRAIILMTFVEGWLLFAIYNYWDVFFQQRTTIQFFSFKSVPFLIIVLLKWFAFIRNDRWKVYEQQFDRWPKAKNLKGTYIVIGIVILIFGNLIFSGYL